MGTWIVEPNVLGGWDARHPVSGEPAQRTSTRESAEAWARALAGAGDEIVVRDGAGSVLARFDSPSTSSPVASGQPAASVPRPSLRTTLPPVPGPATPPRPNPRPEPNPSLAQRLEQEGGTWDSWLDVLLPLGAAVMASGFTPAFLGLGTNWTAIFLGTLSWSGGVAAATYFIKAHKLQGMDAAGAAAVSLLVALAVAYTLGTGVLDVESQWIDGGGHPIARVILAFAFAAFIAYGPVGAVVSGAIGVWLGYRIAQHVPGD